MRKKLRQNMMQDASSSAGNTSMPMVPIPGSRMSSGGVSSSQHHHYQQQQYQRSNNDNKSNRHSQMSRQQHRKSSLRSANLDRHDVVKYNNNDDDDNSTTLTNTAAIDTTTKARTYSTSSESIGQRSYVSTESSDAATTATEAATILTTIAVFGAYGKVGTEFVRLALDAGYRVQAMCLNLQHCSVFADQPNMDRNVGESLEDVPVIAKTIKGAQYVVCLLDDTFNKKQAISSGSTFHQFVRLLYPLMQQEQSVQVLLWQAHSLSCDVYGNTPMMGQLVKTLVRRAPNHDKAIAHMAEKHGKIEKISTITNDADKDATTSENSDSVDDKNADIKPHFSFIVTRPSFWQKEGASARKLAASKSQPGPIPVTHIDLAEFTLNALLNQRLYNTSPYVVADTF